VIPASPSSFSIPQGKDIFAHTGNNFVDAVFAAPLVAALGVPGFSAPFVVLMLVANAWTFRLFARDQLGGGWAAFGAAALWEVNPFTIYEISCGRYTQAFLPFFALSIAWFVRVERARGWRASAWLGLFVGLQGWTYWFSGWFLVFLLTPLALMTLWRAEDRRGLALRYLAAAGVCLVVIAPAALAMLSAESNGEVPGLYSGESVSITTPPKQPSNNVSTALFFGLLKAELRSTPLLTQRVWLVVAAAWLLFGSLRRQWAPGALVVLLFSIGPVLELPNVRGGFVLPWYMAAYHYLPYFDRLWFPYRMVVCVFFVLCLGAGTLLLRLERARGVKVMLAALAVALVTTAVEQHSWRTFPFAVRDVRAPSIIQWLAAQPDGAVMHLPFGFSQSSIVWQTVHQKPLFGGMGENAQVLWPEGYTTRLRSKAIKALIIASRNSREPLPHLTDAERALLVEDGTRWVVLHRGLAEAENFDWEQRTQIRQEGDPAKLGISATRRVVDLLGPPVAVEDALVIWDLRRESVAPEALRPDDKKLYTRTWRSETSPEYEQVHPNKGHMEAPK
jgi:hypothetical protein